MIGAARIREKLRQTPFRPFRLFLSDGSFHDVPHPEFAWVFGGRVFVGLASRNGGGRQERVKELSILHLTRIEDSPRRKPKK
jgi:hypothetical protein